MERQYKDLIFTNHALARMKDRGISQYAVWQVLQNPDLSRPENKPDNTRFIRDLNGRKYHIVATYLPKKQKTLVISAWVRGEEDRVPLVWQLITLPFRILWHVIKMIWQIIKNK